MQGVTFCRLIDELNENVLKVWFFSKNFENGVIIFYKSGHNKVSDFIRIAVKSDSVNVDAGFYRLNLNDFVNALNAGDNIAY